ncbi:MAG: histidinol dehydrogenase [Candidatus Omnitrophota bacterium]
MRVIKYSKSALEKIYNRQNKSKRGIESKVRKIVEDVRSHGDEALIKYTQKFDGLKLTPRQIRVGENEINASYQNIPPKFIDTLKIAIDNINKFYKKQLKKSWKIKDTDGVSLMQRYQPLERVGIYIPAGSAPLVSSVYMTVTLAKLAGVKEIVLATPPNKFKTVDPYILAVANLLEVKEIYKIGGAQAIAALAFGTKIIPKVDKIVGAGNMYVAEAKRQVYGYVDIDMVAGPSEVVVIANQYSNPEFVKADLLAQSEHFMGSSFLVTTSKTLINTLKKENLTGVTAIKVKNLQEAVEITNRIAPEHLQIMIKSPNAILKEIKNAGAIFLGAYTPTAVGDYIAGPSHVLPTGGTARFFSGLNLADFYKSMHIISYSKKALEKVCEPIKAISSLEGLEKHKQSIEVRFK